jgi:uncharacterized membrane protein
MYEGLEYFILGLVALLAVYIAAAVLVALVWLVQQMPDELAERFARLQGGCCVIIALAAILGFIAVLAYFAVFIGQKLL